MTLHALGPFIPPAISLLVIALTVWNLWRIRYAHRARGQSAVEQMLRSRGETLVALKDLPFSKLPAGMGLSSTVVFDIRARGADGEERAYQWAYEPKVFPWQSEGVKRLAHGIWIPV